MEDITHIIMADHCEMNKECPTIYFSVYRRFKPRRKTGK